MEKTSIRLLAGKKKLLIIVDVALVPGPAEVSLSQHRPAVTGYVLLTHVAAIFVCQSRDPDGFKVRAPQGEHDPEGNFICYIK